MYESKDAAFIAWSLREHAKYQRRYRSDVVLHHTDWDRIAQVIEELIKEQKS